MTFTNKTTAVFPYTVPKAHGDDSHAAADASKCCMQLAGDVAWFDSVKYSVHTSSDCNAASRVCGLPGKMASVWLCGCAGGDCSGENKGLDRQVGVMARDVEDCRLPFLSAPHSRCMPCFWNLAAGKHTIVSKSPLFIAASAQQLAGQDMSVASSAQLFDRQGFPTRITVLTTGTKARVMASGAKSSSGGSCSISGFRVEHTLVRSPAAVHHKQL